MSIREEGEGAHLLLLRGRIRLHRHLYRHQHGIVDANLMPGRDQHRFLIPWLIKADGRVETLRAYSPSFKLFCCRLTRRDRLPLCLLFHWIIDTRTGSFRCRISECETVFTQIYSCDINASTIHATHTTRMEPYFTCSYVLKLLLFA